MDRRRAAAALLALAACIACSSAAPTASNQTALELHEGPMEGCYYNFQHYGEGDRIMTNEPCLNCTCHNRMLMCYLRVCPFTKPIGQDCTVEKRADQCCPIVTCPDVPVDLLTSTSTSSPAEYGSTGVGKHDKYGCSINGKYFSEGSKVPSTPNKPCEHCYCIRNMTTCVMQECTLHVDGCTPIYHKEVCCPVRYSCDHLEDEIPLLDDMTTTVRPTPGFLLTTTPTTTTIMPVTQMTQDCVHDDQIFPDGALIKTEKACEHCYCMKGDIVCVVQECGTPMENEGKNCTSLPPRNGQCCPDTYICDGDDRGLDMTTEVVDQPTPPPRRAGVEGSGYRNEPDEPFTEISPYETDIEGSGEDYVTGTPKGTVEDMITEKVSPDIIDELLATTDKGQTSLSTEPDKGQNTIPDIISEKDSSDSAAHDEATYSTEKNVVLTTASEPSIAISDEIKPVDVLVSKEEEFITTESAFRKEDNSIVPDEILAVKEPEKSSTLIDLIDATTSKYTDSNGETTKYNLYQSEQYSTTHTADDVDITLKDILTENNSKLGTTETMSSEEESPKTGEEDIYYATTAKIIEKIDVPETTSVNPVINEVDESISSQGRIPGEGDCLLNGVTYTNNTIVPSTNNCHTSCKCTSSIIKCDPIICSPPPEYMENMNDCQPIYDSPDACCPTYVCSGKETIPPQSHSQMSGTEIPKTSSASDCDGKECALDERQKPIHELSSDCTSQECLNTHIDKQEQSDCGSNDCTHIDHTQIPTLEQSQGCSDNECQVSPVVACEGDKCKTDLIIDSDSDKTPSSADVPSVFCDEKVGCKKPKDTEQEECKDEICRRKDTHELEVKVPSECSGSECKADIPTTLEQEQEPITDSITEETLKDKVTEISGTESNTKLTVIPESNISTIIVEHGTEAVITDVTQKAEIYTESPEQITTVSKTYSELHTTRDQSDHTVPPIVPEKSEKDLDRNTEKEDTESPRVTEQTDFEDTLYTKSPVLQDNKNLVTEATLTEQTTQKKLLGETSESTETKPEELFTEKIQITTEKLNIYTDDNAEVTRHEDIATKAPQVAEVDMAHTKIPEMHYTEYEKYTEPDHLLTSTEKEATLEDITETSGIKEQLTPSDIKETVTQQTDISSTEFNKDTQIYEVTKEPISEFLETQTESTQEKDTKKEETDESYEIITDRMTEEISSVTPIPDFHPTKDETVTINDIGMITESNDIPTETRRPILTNMEEVTNEISQESVTEKNEIFTESNIKYTEIPHSMSTKIDEETGKEDKENITEKHEIVTESSEYSTQKAVEIHEDAQKTTTVQSVYYTETLPAKETKPEVLNEPITEKKISYTESPQTLETEINEISQEFVTERETISPEKQEHLATKADETVTSSSIEKQTDSLGAEEESTKAFESDTHTKEETYTETPKRDTTKAFESETSYKEETYTETPKVYITPSEEFISEDFDKTQNVITELPEFHQMSTAEILTTTKDISENISKDLEKPISSEKESDVTKEPLYTTSNIAEISEHLTEKIDVTVTKFTPSQGFKEDLDILQTTSSVPIGEDKQDIEYHKITTASSDILVVQETTTDLQNLIENTESETKTPLRIDEKPEEAFTEIAEKLPSDSDEISTDKAIQNIPTTEQYETVTPKKDTEVMEETLHEDYSTNSPVFGEKHDLPIDVSKPHEVTEEMFELTTKSSQDSEHVSVPESSKITSQDLEKTTAPSISYVENVPLYTTESFTEIEREDTHKQVTTSDASIDDNILRRTTTEKSSLEEEYLPQSAHEYVPVEAVSEEVTTHTVQHITTEKVQISDISETYSPTGITTKQPEEFTKFEESVTMSILDKKENEIITDLAESYTSSPDSHKMSTPIQSDELDKNLYIQPEIDDKKQVVTVSTDIQFEEDKKVTETPMSLITYKEHTTIPGTLLDKTDLESTTKKFSDQITEVEKKQTITLEEYTTEQPPLPTEVHKEIYTQRQEISSDKILTTGVSESATSSYVNEATLSSLEKEINVDKLEVTTEKQLDQKESEVQPSPAGTPIEEELLSAFEHKTTSIPSEYSEELAPHRPEYQTTVLIGEIETERPHKQITTLPPKLESEEDNVKVTEIIETDERELTTKQSSLDLQETVTGKIESEKSPQAFETESYFVTTESIKSFVTAQNEPDTVAYPSIETVHKDEPTIPITESIETIQTDEHTEMITESVEAIHTDKPNEMITELIEAIRTDKPTEMITESIEAVRTDKPTEKITESIEAGHTDKPSEMITESIEAVRTDKPLEMITESIEAVHTDKPTEKITESIEDLRTDKPIEIITESIEAVHTDKPTEKITESIEDIRTDKPIEKITESIEAVHTDKPTEKITESIEDIRTDKPIEKITELIEAVHTDKPTEKITESIEDIGTDKPIETITESIESVRTDKPITIITESVESIIADQARKTTEIPVYADIQTSTVALEEITEKLDKLETVSTKEIIETMEPQHITVGVQVESSSTEGLHISTKEPGKIIIDTETPAFEVTEIAIKKEDSETEKTPLTNVPSYPKTTDSNIDNQTHLVDEHLSSITEATDEYIKSSTPSLSEKEEEDQSRIHTTESPIYEPVTQKEVDKTVAEDTTTPGLISYTEQSVSTKNHDKPNVVDQSYPTTDSQHKYSETTPFLVELEEHAHHMIDEITTRAPSEDIPTTMSYEPQEPERGDQIPDDFVTNKDEYQTSEPSKITAQVQEDEEKPETHIKVDVENTVAPIKTETEFSVLTEKTPGPTSIYTKLDDVNRDGSTLADEELTSSTALQSSQEKEYTTESIEIKQTSPSSQTYVQPTTEKDIHIESDKPSQPELPGEKLASETTKGTTTKISDETSTYSPSIIDKITKPEEKPIDTTSPQSIPEVPKPGFIDEPSEEVPSPDFPPSASGGYGQETDYVDEDQAFGPGTCRYGGKVYVSAQQIPRDDPCDFCFCFRSDIICLQQSCPPPIHGCHEEPIQGFCCPRYECPVSMATTLNVTTTTTTTTTTLPPHFLPHAYKGAAQRRGCQIKGHTYKVGEVVRASSGPCLHCTCGGDGQMKCDPKACTPEPMLRQMIAAAVSAKRRR